MHQLHQNDIGKRKKELIPLGIKNVDLKIQGLQFLFEASIYQEILRSKHLDVS